MEIPDQDLQAIKKLSLLFRLNKRSKRGAQWEIVDDNLEIELALKIAISEYADYETSIYLRGYQYWTSTSPYLFNSTIIQLAEGGYI